MGKADPEAANNGEQSVKKESVEIEFGSCDARLLE